MSNYGETGCLMEKQIQVKLDTKYLGRGLTCMI